jgi:nicotinamidase-related amidase
MRLDCIVIDGENDFLSSGNEPWNSERRCGSLLVTNADREAVLVADLIDRLGDKINKIHVTLDSHHKKDASHNESWKGQDGRMAPPFTLVSHDDVEAQRWLPVLPLGVWEGKVISSRDWALKYTAALEKHGRNMLCLWPTHCQIGTWGSCVYPPLSDAYDRWCDKTNRWIDFITKGAWPWSEHYSALIADVPDPTRQETQMNVELVKDVAEADMTIWAGWAGSHCFKWTALDAVNFFGKDSNDFLRKSTFLTDCCAAVGDQPGSTMFKDWREDFLKEVQSRGATLTTSTEFLKSF